MVATRHGVIEVHTRWLGELPTATRYQTTRRVLDDADPGDAALIESISAMSDHQRNILRSRAGGSCNREIGEQFGVSEQTIKNTLTAIWIKLALPKGMENKSARACYLLGIYDTIQGAFDDDAVPAD